VCALIDAVQAFPTFSEAFCFALAGSPARCRPAQDEGTPPYHRFGQR